MQQIEIDFEVFKALTNLRQSENHTYNEVLRDLLGLEKSLLRGFADVVSKASGRSGALGFVASGRFLPHGTLLRARYKGYIHQASVNDGAWVNDDGTEYKSASAAARAITQTNVNGLTFWEVKRPSDTEWRKLDAMPKSTK
ncbi:DUF2924 domain-containing protein [Pseudonocardia sp. TMWB2A]|uniref:DUF2924 domain-containing protein n=1 Tax=Pseudonocardia sp. TMWB2A TaxID=687430 RepID=UPI00307F89CB